MSSDQTRKPGETQADEAAKATRGAKGGKEGGDGGSITKPDKAERAKHYKPFVIEQTFPDASAVFSFKPKTLPELIRSATVFLDANVLLAPYQASPEQLAELRKVCKGLVDKNRLVVPAQAAREFARHRHEKLKELVDGWDAVRSKNLQIDGAKANPILSDLPAFKKVKEIEKSLREKITEYRDALDSVRREILNWHLDDPVSVMYRDLLPGRVIDTKADRSELLEDCRHRQVHELPPGYQDGAKLDEGVGDLLIWHTMLEYCTQYNSDAIFVTNDAKIDWTFTTLGEPKQQLFARSELIEEFRVKTKGHSFMLLSFSRFLDEMKASKDFVAQMQQAEQKASQAAGQTTSLPSEAGSGSGAPQHGVSHLQELLNSLSIDQEYIVTHMKNANNPIIYQMLEICAYRLFNDKSFAKTIISNVKMLNNTKNLEGFVVLTLSLSPFEARGVADLIRAYHSLMPGGSPSGSR